VSPDELRQVLDTHHKWLRSDRSEGGRADLRRADLQGVDLEGKDLRAAGLRKANLKDARLFGANFEKASLQKADLQNAVLTDACLAGADLRKANLRYAELGNVDLHVADLTGADLTGADLARVRGLDTAKLNNIDLTNATGLLGNEFAGDDIIGAKLPDDIARFDGLKYVETASKQARTVFLAMGAGCVYAWLTIWTTTDAMLIVNSAETKLPIIQASVPIVGFYWAAPLILLGLYFYLHLYLQGLWEALARLPGIFPDGSAIDEKCYPWLLMSLARAHVPILEDRQPPLWWLRVGLSLLAAWGLVPLTLFLMWLRYLPRHDAIGAILLIASLLAAVWSGVFFYRMMRTALRRKPAKYGGRFPLWEFAAVALVAAPTAVVSYAAIGSGRQIEFLGYGLYAELTKEKIGLAEIGGMDLRFAEAITAELTGADLEGTDLHGSNLQDAELEGVNLKSSILAGANLKRANLKSANLKWADLEGANLSGADLEGARLTGANLKGANLEGACLKDVNLKGVILEDADLRDADLTEARLGGSNLQGANLANANLKDARFDEDVSWWKYSDDSDLDEAVKHAVNMQGAELKGANLAGANLSRVERLTPLQLEDACGNDKTERPRDIALPTLWTDPKRLSDCKKTARQNRACEREAK